MDDELVPSEYGDAEPGWSPRGEHEAEMALRGLERLSAKFQAIQQQGFAYRADIDAWENAEIQRLRSKATNLVLGLQSWARDRRLVSNHKDKTLRFPSGVLETRVGRGKVVIEDEAALLEWCRSSFPDAVKTVESVLVSVLTKGCEQIENRLVLDGEVVPGCSWLSGENRISVEVKLASQRPLPAIGTGNA